MTDPIAEAAASLNAPAQPAGTDPSMFDEIKETIHDLQEKVEHLIHPETTDVAPEPAPVAADSAGAAPVADVHAGSTTAVSQTMAQPPVVMEEASTIAPVEAGNVAPAATGESLEAHASVAAEDPNAIASPAAEPSESATASSALPVSSGADTPVERVSGGLDEGVSGAIRTHLDAIKQHLSLRGFEQSCVQGIHDEIAAIEGYL